MRNVKIQEIFDIVTRDSLLSYLFKKTKLKVKLEEPEKVLFALRI